MCRLSAVLLIRVIRSNSMFLKEMQIFIYFIFFKKSVSWFYYSRQRLDLSIHPGGTIGGWVQQAEFCDWYSKLNKCEICVVFHIWRGCEQVRKQLRERAQRPLLSQQCGTVIYNERERADNDLSQFDLDLWNFISQLREKNIKYLTNQLRIELFSMLKAFAMTARIKLFLKA